MVTQSALCASTLCILCKEEITIIDSTDYIILLRVTIRWEKIRILLWLLLIWEAVPFLSYLTHSWCIAHYTRTNFNMFCYYTYHISLQAVSVCNNRCDHYQYTHCILSIPPKQYTVSIASTTLLIQTHIAHILECKNTALCIVDTMQSHCIAHVRLSWEADRQTDRDSVVQLLRHGIAKVSGTESFNN
jgi:hypothetical protein